MRLTTSVGDAMPAGPWQAAVVSSTSSSSSAEAAAGAVASRFEQHPAQSQRLEPVPWSQLYGGSAQYQQQGLLPAQHRPAPMYRSAA